MTSISTILLFSERVTLRVSDDEQGMDGLRECGGGCQARRLSITPRNMRCKKARDAMMGIFLQNVLKTLSGCLTSSAVLSNAFVNRGGLGQDQDLFGAR